jgi:hypothetical protein
MKVIGLNLLVLLRGLLPLSLHLGYAIKEFVQEDLHLARLP